MASGFCTGHTGPRAPRDQRASPCPRRPGMSVPRPQLRSRGRHGRRDGVGHGKPDTVGGKHRGRGQREVAVPGWGQRQHVTAGNQRILHFSQDLLSFSPSCQAEFKVAKLCPKSGNCLSHLKRNEDTIAGFRTKIYMTFLPSLQIPYRHF